MWRTVPSICNGSVRGFCVSHPANAETGVQLPESASEPIEVRPFTTYPAVCISGRAFGAIGVGSRSTHDLILDLAAVQYLNQTG